MRPSWQQCGNFSCWAVSGGVASQCADETEFVAGLCLLSTFPSALAACGTTQIDLSSYWSAFLQCALPDLLACLFQRRRCYLHGWKLRLRRHRRTRLGSEFAGNGVRLQKRGLSHSLSCPVYSRLGTSGRSITTNSFTFATGPQNTNNGIACAGEVIPLPNCYADQVLLLFTGVDSERALAITRC